MKQESDSSAGPSQTASPPGSSLRRNLTWLFLFALGFGGYLFFARPVTTTAQLIFRIGLLLVGAGGLLSLAIFLAASQVGRNGAEQTRAAADGT